MQRVSNTSNIVTAIIARSCAFVAAENALFDGREGRCSSFCVVEDLVAAGRKTHEVSGSGFFVTSEKGSGAEERSKREARALICS
jgi:hypothetical protein